MLQTNYTEDQYTAILDERAFEIMRETFNMLDQHNDLIVRRSELLKELRVSLPQQTNAMAKTIHDRDVFYVGILGQHIKFKQVLRFIEDEMAEGMRLDPKGLEYVTWGEVESYFRLLRKARLSDSRNLC